MSDLLEKIMAVCSALYTFSDQLDGSHLFGQSGTSQWGVHGDVKQFEWSTVGPERYDIRHLLGLG